MNATSEGNVFRIHGMDCAEEVAVLKRALGPPVGGQECLAFDMLNGKLEHHFLVGRLARIIHVFKTYLPIVATFARTWTC